MVRAKHLKCAESNCKQYPNNINLPAMSVRRDGNSFQGHINHSKLPVYNIGMGNACHFGCISAHIRNGITLYSLPQQLLRSVV
jgi:hypothetical protein